MRWEIPIGQLVRMANRKSRKRPSDENEPVESADSVLDPSDPLVQLVRSMQTVASRRLLILNCLGIFNELHLYSIVNGYVTVKCIFTESRPEMLTSLGCRVDDRVGAPAFSGNLTGVRICFPSVPTFKSLDGNLDIGLTIRAAPHPELKKYLGPSESEYITIPIERMGKANTVSWVSDWRSPTQDTPLTNRIAFIDIILDNIPARDQAGGRYQQTMTVRVAHAKSAKSTDLEFVQRSSIRYLSGRPLYPLLSSRTPLGVSLHPLEDFTA